MTEQTSHVKETIPLNPQERRFIALMDILDRTRTIFDNTRRGGKEIDELVSRLVTMFSRVPNTTDNILLKSFLDTVINYRLGYDHTKESARRGSMMHNSHLSLISNILEPTAGDGDTLIFQHLVQAQQQLVNTISPFLRRIARQSDRFAEVKSMNAATNALMFFKSMYPESSISPTSIEVDMQHKIDFTVKIPATANKRERTLYVNLKSGEADEVVCRRITDRNDIHKLLYRSYQQELERSLNYFWETAGSLDMLLFLRTPNKIVDIEILASRKYAITAIRLAI